MRIPDRAFRLLERVYLHQNRIRRAELRERVAAEDRALRAYWDRKSEAHDSGRCGGAENGCGYFPCVPRVGV